MLPERRYQILILTVLLLVQVAIAAVWLRSETRHRQKRFEEAILQSKLAHETGRRELNEKHSRELYLATGKDAYERIYNTQGQSIQQMIERLTEEATPKGWKCEALVEEFTRFALLVHTNMPEDELDVSKVHHLMQPFLRHAQPYLGDIAVYDNRCQCVLFFDELLLNDTANAAALSDEALARARSQGRGFKAYSSVAIPFVAQEGHMFVEVVISGERGQIPVVMMLDTGASSTIINLQLAAQTGTEDLRNAPRQKYRTASGTVECALVKRSVVVGDLTRQLNVGVNSRAEMCLLGMDFFAPMEYLIASSEGRIYIWQKRRPDAP